MAKIVLRKTEEVVEPSLAAFLPELAIGLPPALAKEAEAEAARRGVPLSQVAAEYWARQVVEELDK